MGEIHDLYGTVSPDRYIMELDDGIFFTGNPYTVFDGKNHGFRFRFSPTNQSMAYTLKWPFISLTPTYTLTKKDASPTHRPCPAREPSRSCSAACGATTPVNVHPVC